MEEHLIREIRRRFMRLPKSRRVSEIKAFLSESSVNRKLIKKAFPDFAQEVESSRTRYQTCRP